MSQLPPAAQPPLENSADDIPELVPLDPDAYDDDEADAVDIDETEIDEEVDQLDSDTDDNQAASGKQPRGTTASGKPRQRRAPAQRVAGQPAISLDRLETILDAEGASVRVHAHASVLASKN